MAFFYVGFVLDVLLVASIKLVVQRRRPTYDDFKFHFGPDSFSFPSGHSSRALFILLYALFMVLDSRSIWSGDFTNAVGFVVLGGCVAFWALFVAYSRVALGRHYFSDMVFGAFLGILEYELCVQAYHYALTYQDHLPLPLELVSLHAYAS